MPFRAIEGGVPIKLLNVGSMAHSTGKTMVNNVLSMDKEDVLHSKICDLGVEFDGKYQMTLRKICST